MQDIYDQGMDLFARILAALESPEEAMAFLEDLSRPEECWIISKRLIAAELLLREYQYDDIAWAIQRGGKNISPPTITRVSKTLKAGNGSLERMIRRVNGDEGYVSLVNTKAP